MLGFLSQAMWRFLAPLRSLDVDRNLRLGGSGFIAYWSNLSNLCFLSQTWGQEMTSVVGGFPTFWIQLVESLLGSAPNSAQ